MKVKKKIVLEICGVGSIALLFGVELRVFSVRGIWVRFILMGIDL